MKGGDEDKNPVLLGLRVQVRGCTLKDFRRQEALRVRRGQGQHRGVTGTSQLGRLHHCAAPIN